MLVATVWAAGFSIPVFVAVKVPPPPAELVAERTGFLGSYRMLLLPVKPGQGLSPLGPGGHPGLTSFR